MWVFLLQNALAYLAMPLPWVCRFIVCSHKILSLWPGSISIGENPVDALTSVAWAYLKVSKVMDLVSALMRYHASKSVFNYLVMPFRLSICMGSMSYGHAEFNSHELHQ